METIKISERKLKIMMTEDDLQKYDMALPVDVETLCGRQRLRRVLRDACCDAGFDADSARAFVQIYESAHGGCELFVTLPGKSVGGEGNMTPRSFLPRTRQERGIYEFPDLDSLLAVCRRLDRPGRADTAAYAGRDGGYYLLTYESESKLDAICGEYGGERCISFAEAYLTEHCSLICERDAVGVLGALG